MLKRLFDQIVDTLASPASAGEDDGAREATLRMATVVLMIDVARADHVFEDSEFDQVLKLVESQFGFTGAEAAQLVETATDKAEQLTSAYEFTTILHKHLDEAEKAKIISLLWQIAYADGRLDKYEDSLVLKISDLLHVRRGRVMRLKHDAKLEARQRDT
jgi:uncharacterized tellurite resistance protein B-like protein